MRNDEDCRVLEALVYHFADCLISRRVDAGGSFIHDEYLVLPNQSSGKDDQLLLAGGKATGKFSFIAPLSIIQQYPNTAGERDVQDSLFATRLDLKVKILKHLPLIIHLCRTARLGPRSIDIQRDIELGSNARR